jgi:cholest-4-en-3-one 26-monooxygenase
VYASPFDERVTVSFEEVCSGAGLWVYALEHVELRTQDPHDDVMTAVMAQYVPDRTTTSEEVQGNMSLLASGAAENTLSSLGHGTHELMRNREQVAWIQGHRDDIPKAAAQEIVRSATRFTHLVRTATKDAGMHSQHIKTGDQIAMLFASGSFDPDAIENPRQFDLSRDPNLFLSFGRGPHSCLGKHIAAFEIKTLLEEFFQRVKASGGLRQLRQGQLHAWRLLASHHGPSRVTGCLPRDSW